MNCLRRVTLLRQPAVINGIGNDPRILALATRPIRQAPRPSAMCHNRLSNQLNTFLKHEEKGIHDPPRRSHGYLEPRRGIDFFRKVASCCHPADCTLSPWQHTHTHKIMVRSKASGYATKRQIPMRRPAATPSHKGGPRLPDALAGAKPMLCFAA